MPRGNQVVDLIICYKSGGIDQILVKSFQETIMRCLYFAIAAAFALPQTAMAATCNTASSIYKVRNYKLGAFEYVDFWIKTPYSGTPAVTAPSTGVFTEDPSGNTITVAGNRWTDVKFTSMSWMCTSLTQISVPKPRIKAIKRIAQYEGTIEYVIGRRYGSPPVMTITPFVGYKRVRFRFN